MAIGKISIRPTRHYLLYHSDVDWPTIVNVILSPHETRANIRHGKNRFTYIRKFKKYVIELHAERDDIEEIIWVINAFRIER